MIRKPQPWMYYGLIGVALLLGLIALKMQSDFIQSLINQQSQNENFLIPTLLAIFAFMTSRYSTHLKSRLETQKDKLLLYNTHISFIEAIVLGGVFVSIFYFVSFSINRAENQWVILLLEKIGYRGQVPILTIFFFFVAMAIAVLKLITAMQIRKGYREYRNAILTDSEPSVEQTDYSFVGLRFNFTQRKPEQSNEYLADLDREELVNSYTFMRFLIWAIPVLGFIGTVWGISESINRFTDALGNAGVSGLSPELLRPALSFLSVAFDTTLIALSFGILAMFLSSFLQKMEESLLSNCHLLLSKGIDAYLKEQGHDHESTEISNLGGEDMDVMPSVS